MRHWLRVTLVVLAALVLAVPLGIAIVLRPPWDLHDGESPRFATSDVMNLAKVWRVSKFRSGAGHDFSQGPESCRSMKHYVWPSTVAFGPDGFPAPTNETIDIRAPIDGLITSISSENHPVGMQFTIRSTAHPAYRVRLFHVDPAPGVHALSRVHAGQVIGTIKATSDTDVAVDVTTWHGFRFVSFYDILTDEAFAPYAAKNVTRADLVLAKEYRDAHPLQCDPSDPQERFVGRTGDDPGDWVVLGPASAAFDHHG